MSPSSCLSWHQYCAALILWIGKMDYLYLLSWMSVFSCLSFCEYGADFGDPNGQNEGRVHVLYDKSLLSVFIMWIHEKCMHMHAQAYLCAYIPSDHGCWTELCRCMASKSMAFVRAWIARIGTLEGLNALPHGFKIWKITFRIHCGYYRPIYLHLDFVIWSCVVSVAGEPGGRRCRWIVTICALRCGAHYIAIY